MQHVTIKITRLDNHEPPYPDKKFSGRAKVEDVEIAEGMMLSGKAAVNFIVQLENGQYHFVEMSEGIMESIAAALTGAKQHWAENPLPKEEDDVNPNNN